MVTSYMIGLIDLPSEIIVTILAAGLDCRSIVRCMQVCKTLRGVIQESKLLLYFIELEAAGLLDNPNSTVPLHERLDLCRRMHSSWEDVKKPNINGYIIDQEDPNCIKLCQGHLCYSRGHRKGEDLISVIKFPSSISGEKLGLWTLPPVPYRVRSLEIDPSQDLLILWVAERFDDSPEPEHALLVLSLTTGQYHPECPNHVIELPGNFRSTMETPWCTLLVRGCFVSVTFTISSYPTGHYFAVVNWKTGQLPLVLEGTEITSGTLIDSRHALIIVKRDQGDRFIHVILIYAYQEQNSDGTGGTFTHVRSMALCKAIRDKRSLVWSISPAVSVCNPSRDLPPDRSPFFRHNSMDDVISLCLSTSNAREVGAFGILSLQVKTLLGQDDLTCTVDEPEVYPWKVWSTNKTTWYFAESGSWDIDCCCYGQRIVTWESSIDGAKQLVVLDTNLARVMRIGGNNNDSSKVNWLKSYLPQRVSFIELDQYDGEAERVMVDDERVVHLMTYHNYQNSDSDSDSEGEEEKHIRRIVVRNMIPKR